MENNKSNTLILFKKRFISSQALESEMKLLIELIFSIKHPEQFCNAHELVDRNRITSKKKKILKESGNNPLRTFRFLINKN